MAGKGGNVYLVGRLVAVVWLQLFGCSWLVGWLRLLQLVRLVRLVRLVAVVVAVVVLVVDCVGC